MGPIILIILSVVVVTIQSVDSSHILDLHLGSDGLNMAH